MNKAYYFVLAVIIILLSGSNSNIFAQKNSNGIREKIEKIKLEKLLKKLDLDESTKAVFTEKYKSYSSTIKELNAKRFKAYKLMAENLESGEGLDTLVNLVLNYEDEVNKEKIQFAEDLKTILTPKQLATMIIFERKFNNEILKILRDYKKNN
jgi:hypothetical protein